MAYRVQAATYLADAMRGLHALLQAAPPGPLSAADLLLQAQYVHIIQVCERLLLAPVLVSPRARHLAYHMQETSFWAHLRDKRKDGAFMRFTGLHIEGFRQLGVAFKPFVPKYDRDVPRGFGRSPVMDHWDLLAFMLCRLQLLTRKDNQVLAQTFKMSGGNVTKTVAYALPRFFNCLRANHLARIEYPTQAAVDAMEVAYVAQHGAPVWGPVVARQLNVALIIDGSLSPVVASGDDEIQRRYADHHDGHSLNNIATITLGGVIADATVGHFGPTHDFRASAAMIARHQNPAFNVDLLGLFGDAAWVGARTTYAQVLAGRPAILTPATTGFFVAAHAAWNAAVDAEITRRRVNVERFFGNHHKSFPRWNRIALMADVESGDTSKDLMTMLYVWNFRTRVLGYNAVQTTYLRHVSDWFAVALRGAAARDPLEFYLDTIEQALAGGETFGFGDD